MKLKIFRVIDVVTILTFLLFFYVSLDSSQPLMIRGIYFGWFLILVISFVHSIRDRITYNTFIKIKETSEVSNEVEMDDKDRLNYLMKQGKALERRVYSTIKTLYKDAIVYEDILIPSNHQQTTQIDAFAIIDQRLYVFECKAYNVQLSGSWDDKKLYAHYQTPIEIDNPVLQNQYHIKSLSKFLFHGEDHYANIIVFGDYATYEYLKMPKYTRVTKAKDLKKNIDALKQYMKPIDLSILEEIKKELEVLSKQT